MLAHHLTREERVRAISESGHITPIVLYYRSLCKFVKSSIQLSRLGISFILAGNSLLEAWES